MFNPRPEIHQVALDAAHACVVIDQALLAPERLPAYADAYREDFQPSTDDPGSTRLRMPPEFTALLQDVVREHARRALGARRVLYGTSWLVRGSSLAPAQAPARAMPRRARAFEPDRMVAVAELCLFDATLADGMHFYLPKVSPQQVERMEHDARSLPEDDFAGRYALAPGFPREPNGYFEHVRTLVAQWNRLIIHDGAFFHAPAMATAHSRAAGSDPGCLTLQALFTCRRPCAAW